MNCTQVQPLLDPYLDGELDAAARETVAAHLRECGECAAMHRRNTDLSRAARELRHVVPPGLDAMIRSSIRSDFENRRTRSLRIWRTIAIAACVLLAFSLIAPRLMSRPESEEYALADQLVANHVRSLMADHLLDVPSSDQHTVKPWFAGKVDFSPDVRDFADQGYTLRGGRLEYLAGRPAAALVYQHAKHIINAYTWPAAGELPKSETRQGYHVLTWRDGQMEWCLVSDASEKTLSDLKDLIEQTATRTTGALPMQR